MSGLLLNQSPDFGLFLIARPVSHQPNAVVPVTLSHGLVIIVGTHVVLHKISYSQLSHVRIQEQLVDLDGLDRVLHSCHVCGLL